MFNGILNQTEAFSSILIDMPSSWTSLFPADKALSFDVMALYDSTYDPERLLLCTRSLAHRTRYLPSMS